MVGHALLAAELLVDRERLLVHLLGPVELAARLVDDPEVAVLAGHALLAAELLVDRQRLLVHLFGPVEFAARLVDEPEVAVGGGRVARLGLASTDGEPAFEHVLGGLQVSGAVIELVGEIQHPQVGRPLMGLGEGLARLFDPALQRRCGRLLGEREGQLVGPRGLGLGMLLMRLRALDGRLGLGLGLRDFFDVLERQDHGARAARRPSGARPWRRPADAGPPRP